MVNQRGPTGTLQYNQIGTFPDGTPRYESVTQLSPEQQQLFNLYQQSQKNLGNISVQQSGKIGSLLNEPIDLNNEDVEARLYDLGSKRLDPRFAREEDQLRTALINRGYREGTPGFDAEIEKMRMSKNDAYNQLALTGRGQAIQEKLTERNQPINEITALMSGSQVSTPNFTPYPQTPVSGVDIAGLMNQEYQAKLASQNGMMGGLFGLGGTAASALMMSDRRLKRDVMRVGTADNGLPLYVFRFSGRDDLQLGLMADDVERMRPDAVFQVEGGFKAVDYARALA